MTLCRDGFTLPHPYLTEAPDRAYTRDMSNTAATIRNLEAAIALKVEILDTYEGMASMYDGEGEYPGHVFDRIDDLEREIASLEAEYNRALLVLEGAL